MVANLITRSVTVVALLCLSGVAISQSISLPAPDSTTDKYKLIFPKVYKDPSSYPLKKARDGAPFLEFKRGQLNTFLNELNDAGARGYKLVAAAHDGIPVGIVRLEGQPYEYDLVITNSIISSLEDRKDRYEQLSQQGFHAVSQFEIITYCRDTNGDGDSYTADPCQAVDVFVMERKKGAEKPRQYGLIYPAGRWQGPLHTWLTDQIKEKLAKGFQPTRLVAEYGIMVEQLEEDGPSIQWADVEVVPASKYWTADHSKSRINNLAERGYRLAMLNSRIALMYKDPATTTPVTYLWLHTTTQWNWRIEKRKREDLEEKLAKLEAAGAVYRTTYVDNQEYSKLIFEQNPAGDRRRNEYKIFAFDFVFQKNVAASSVSVQLTLASNERLKILNSLAKDGFVVRDLFISGGYNVLLERLTLNPNGTRVTRLTMRQHSNRASPYSQVAR